MEVVSSNSSSIIFLAKLDSFYLVKNLFKNLFISEEVKDDLFKYEKAENNIVKKEISSGFIKVVGVKKMKNIPVHLGEKSAISLCLEKNINIFMSDDKKARSYSRFLGLNTLGVLGIILNNLDAKFISKKKAKDFLNALLDVGYSMDTVLYSRVLDLIN